jgi:hypothetical protein
MNLILVGSVASWYSLSLNAYYHAWRLSPLVSSRDRIDEESLRAQQEPGRQPGVDTGLSIQFLLKALRLHDWNTCDIEIAPMWHAYLICVLELMPVNPIAVNPAWLSYEYPLDGVSCSTMHVLSCTCESQPLLAKLHVLRPLLAKFYLLCSYNSLRNIPLVTNRVLQNPCNRTLCGVKFLSSRIYMGIGVAWA